MARLKTVPEDTDDPAARALLERIRSEWGRTWNITRGLANNPNVLEGYLAFTGALEKGGLSEMDREVICMEMARSNGCHYCVPAHRYVSKHKGLDVTTLERIARGEALEGDERPANMQRLVRRLLATKGRLPDAELEAYQAAGIAPAELIAVIAEIAHCTLTNYFNRLADTDLDPFLEPYRD